MQGGLRVALHPFLCTSTTIPWILWNLKECKMIKVNITSSASFTVTPERLLATGAKADAKLIKAEPYEMSLVEFCAKCSSPMRKEVEAYLEKRLTIAKQEMAATTIKEEPKEGYKPGNRFQAMNSMVKKLKSDFTGELSTDEKGEWLASFVGNTCFHTTAATIQMGVSNGTLYVWFPKDWYKANQAKCQKVIQVIRGACRGSKLEYGELVNGQLPIKVRGAWARPEI